MTGELEAQTPIEDLDENERQLMEAMSEQMKLLDYVAKAGESIIPGTPLSGREEIIKALQTVSDPEISINIWDMGLIYDLRQEENGDVFIDMTVTAPTCPVAGILPSQAAEAVAALPGCGKVEVRLVWEPAWTFERMSDDARMMFELF